VRHLFGSPWVSLVKISLKKSVYHYHSDQPSVIAVLSRLLERPVGRWRKRRLSQISATAAENAKTTATVAEFGDSRTFLRQSLFSATNCRTFLRQCGQALTSSQSEYTFRRQLKTWLFKKSLPLPTLTANLGKYTVY